MVEASAAEVAEVDQHMAAFAELTAQLLSIHARSKALSLEGMDLHEMAEIRAQLMQLMMEHFMSPEGAKLIFSYIMYLVDLIAIQQQLAAKVSQQVDKLMADIKALVKRQAGGEDGPIEHGPTP